MESLKELNERAVGDRFVRWFNTKFGLEYSFSRRAGEAPDLVYALPNGSELFIEVTSASYGSEYQKFIWDGVRSGEDQLLVTRLGSPDNDLVSDIVRIVNQKCRKRYEKHCILVVSITSFYTSAETLVELLYKREIPENNFAGIYVDGRFSGEDDYSIIPIKSYSNSDNINT